MTECVFWLYLGHSEVSVIVMFLVFLCIFSYAPSSNLGLPCCDKKAGALVSGICNFHPSLVTCATFLTLLCHIAARSHVLLVVS